MQEKDNKELFSFGDGGFRLNSDCESDDFRDALLMCSLVDARFLQGILDAVTVLLCAEPDFVEMYAKEIQKVDSESCRKIIDTLISNIQNDTDEKRTFEFDLSHLGKIKS